jgi:hypothetical protein
MLPLLRNVTLKVLTKGHLMTKMGSEPVDRLGAPFRPFGLHFDFPKAVGLPCVWRRREECAFIFDLASAWWKGSPLETVVQFVVS